MAPVHWGGADCSEVEGWGLITTDYQRSLRLATTRLEGDEGRAALLHWGYTLTRDTTLEVPRIPQGKGSKTVRKEELGVHAVRDGP